jgi:hypothetical protein
VLGRFLLLLASIHPRLPPLIPPSQVVARVAHAHSVAGTVHAPEAAIALVMADPRDWDFAYPGVDVRRQTAVSLCSHAALAVREHGYRTAGAIVDAAPILHVAADAVLRELDLVDGHPLRHGCGAEALAGEMRLDEEQERERNASKVKVARKCSSLLEKISLLPAQATLRRASEQEHQVMNTYLPTFPSA